MSQIVNIWYVFNVWYYNLKTKLIIMRRLNVYKKNVLNRMIISMQVTIYKAIYKNLMYDYNVIPNNKFAFHEIVKILFLTNLNFIQKLNNN